MQKRKSYTIKLPRQYQKRFSRPYDKFVCDILTYGDDLTPELIQNSSSNHEEGKKNWLVGLNTEDQAKFRKRKLEIMPYATNTQFVDALLLVSERKSAIANHGTHNKRLDNSILKYKMNGVGPPTA
jgi:hypothetical protein